MEKQITLISGTSKGIGKALAEYFLSKNHIVFGFSRSNISWEAQNYFHFTGDVADENFISSVFREIKARYGKLDNLINNAGIASMNHSFLTPKSTVQNVLNTNIVGTFLLCREAGKLMRAKSYGRIVNFSTVAVPLKLEGEAIYAASKAAVVTLTQILAKEFGQFGITVNALGPTPVATDLIKSVPQLKINKLIDMQIIKRMGSFEDIFNVIDFLIHPNSSFITGQQIYLGGVSA